MNGSVHNNSLAIDVPSRILVCVCYPSRLVHISLFVDATQLLEGLEKDPQLL